MSGVLITDSFVESAYELPKEVAAKVWKAIYLFCKHPQSPGLNLERLKGVAPGLLSIRADQRYRVVLCEGQASTVLLYVGPHDAALRYAERFAHPCPEAARTRVSGSSGETRAVAGHLTSVGEARTPPVIAAKPAAFDVIGPLLKTRKYLALAKLLLRQGADVGALELTFERIESEMGAPLPRSARQYRPWWANSIQRHSQASAWLGVGWRVAAVDLRARHVRFERSPMGRPSPYAASGL